MKYKLLIVLCIVQIIASAKDIKVNNIENCGVNKQARELARLLIVAKGQHRTELICNKELALAAREKAKQMAEVEKIYHNINHQTPNQFLRSRGFQLPEVYRIVGNQVEAASGGMETAEETFDFFMTSSEHKKHLLGENEFYQSQNQIGVGFYEDVSKKYEQYWIVYITNKKSDNDEPLFNTKFKTEVYVKKPHKKKKIRKEHPNVKNIRTL